MRSAKILESRKITDDASLREQLESHCAQIRADRRLIQESQIFDTEFYLSQLESPLLRGHDAITHYLLVGANLRLNPHPLFDTNFYLLKNPDVAASNQNPLVHFLKRGGFERRNPCPSFNSKWYLRQYPDVLTTLMNPLVHYVKHGASEGRNPAPNTIAVRQVEQRAEPKVHDSNVPHGHTSAKDAAADLGAKMLFPPGHFYSPIVDQAELKAYLQRREIFDTPPSNLPGINLRADEQLRLLNQMASHGQKIPFPDNEEQSFRYYFDNNFFSNGDASMLFAMLLEFRPKQLIEVGSGFSSAAMLDVNDQFLDNSIEFTFIEPYPERLLELLKPGDLKHTKLLDCRVQDCSTDIFRLLEENDVLFIDSSHVSKAGSDLNYLLFEALPVLKPGVLVHFHDIFYPFEYPADWLKEGRNWNENYLLRSFLTNNHDYEILIFNSFLHRLHRQPLLDFSPKCHKSFGSLWLRKRAE